MSSQPKNNSSLSKDTSSQPKNDETPKNDAASKAKNEYRQLRDTVYTFFYYSNKPVGLSEICLQFKDSKKPTIQKILDDLVEKEKIFQRTLGKLKVYCLAQNMSYSVDKKVYTDEIDSLQDQEIEDKVLRYLKWNYERHAEELAKLKEECRACEMELKGFEGQLSVEELRRAIKNMKKAVEEYKLQDKGESVSYKEFNAMKKEQAVLKKELQKRNGILNEIVSQVCEGCGMKKKDLLEEAGIE